MNPEKEKEVKHLLLPVNYHRTWDFIFSFEYSLGLGESAVVNKLNETHKEIAEFMPFDKIDVCCDNDTVDVYINENPNKRLRCYGQTHAIKDNIPVHSWKIVNNYNGTNTVVLIVHKRCGYLRLTATKEQFEDLEKKVKDVLEGTPRIDGGGGGGSGGGGTKWEPMNPEPW